MKEKPHYKKGEHSPLQSTKTLPFLGSTVSFKGVMAENQPSRDQALIEDNNSLEGDYHCGVQQVKSFQVRNQEDGWQPQADR